MTTKRFIVLVISIISTSYAYAQALGNYNYRGQMPNYGNQAIAIQHPQSMLNYHPEGELNLTIRGLYNCTADNYLAIFSMTQVGKDQQEVNEILNTKIDSVKSHLARFSNEKVELFIDMISFVPMYEYEVEKKIFSKKTYHEVPVGFELKKNLHFKYSDPTLLDILVTICAEQGIYDLVRVDYFVEDMQKKKEEMIVKAQGLLNKKIARYSIMLKEDYNKKDRMIADGFAVHYPIEQYQSYQAYCSNSLSVKSNANVNNATKTTSQFYMPKVNKGYDFVENPSLLEPVVQIEYEIKLRLYTKPKEEKPKESIKKEIEIKKEIFLITPDANIKKLTF